MTITEKVAYLKGLSDGLGIDTEKSKEGKLISVIIDILEEMGMSIEDLEENATALGEELDAVSDDLADVEELLYGEDEDDECCCGHDHDHEHHHHHDDECGCGHDHHHHHHADEVFTSWGQETVKTFTKEQIEGILKKLSEDTAYGMVLRAKGMVAGADGQWIYFDMVPEEYEVRDGAPEFTGRICVIGSKLAEDKLAELFGL